MASFTFTGKDRSGKHASAHSGHSRVKLERGSEEQRNLATPPPVTTPPPAATMELNSSEKPITAGSILPVSTTSTDVESLEKPTEEWKPHKKEWFIMISLSLISLMVSLDATILVTVLPVRHILVPCLFMVTDVVH